MSKGPPGVRYDIPIPKTDLRTQQPIPLFAPDDRRSSISTGPPINRSNTPVPQAGLKTEQPLFTPNDRKSSISRGPPGVRYDYPVPKSRSSVKVVEANRFNSISLTPKKSNQENASGAEANKN